MNTLSLNKLRVLITRPSHQQEHFRDLLVQNGAIPISLATIEITPSEEVESVQKQLKSLKSFDYVIFVSPNAVNFANRFQPLPWGGSSCKVVSIGDVTTKTLLNYGVVTDVVPNTKFSSESLLELSEFQSVNKRRIAIVSGDSGRTLLQDELQGRGATVKTVVVYKSAAPKYSKESLYGIFNESPPQIICITSNQGILNLVSIVDHKFREQLLKTPLIVNSTRCSNLSRELGFTSDVIVANNPGDTGQLEGLRQWYSNHIFNHSE